MEKRSIHRSKRKCRYTVRLVFQSGVMIHFPWFEKRGNRLVSFRSFEKYSSALFTLLPGSGVPRNPVRSPSGRDFLLSIAIRRDQRCSFPCVASTRRTPSHRKRTNDSTICEWFIRDVVRKFVLSIILLSASFRSPFWYLSNGAAKIMAVWEILRIRIFYSLDIWTFKCT